jgi:uncharacterized small protein (DUF1192 family)
MSIFDEDRPKKPAAAQPGERLDTLSVDELRERIEIYRAEIARLEASIEAKEKSRRAATLFSAPGEPARRSALFLRLRREEEGITHLRPLRWRASPWSPRYPLR